MSILIAIMQIIPVGALANGVVEREIEELRESEEKGKRVQVDKKNYQINSEASIGDPARN